ncbi:MAG: NCS2 family permease [Bacteroidetes bacterium]|nr:NCS2 family permease [Bacteroidota bacterium]
MLERFFRLQHFQTNVRTEALAGFTTFLTMGYIIFVNPSILEQTGMDKSALVAVTCLIAAFSTLLMALIPRVPIAMAPGMGMNAFFTYTLVLTYGISWQAALGIVFWAGCLFLLLSLVGARRKILQAIPPSLITAISVGIGLFLLFIGLQNMGIIVAHPATLVTMGEFSTTGLIGIAGLFLIIYLLIKNIKGAILVGIVFSTILSLVLGLVELPKEAISLNIDISPIFMQLDLFGALKLSLIGPIFALMYMDLFDTLGTLVACSHEANLVKKDGTINNLSKMLNVDAVATIGSGLLGSSPTTSFIESATGISEGGRTGLTSVVTGIFFLLALLFVPFIAVVPNYATAPALIVVGIFMIKQVVKIDFTHYEESIPAILTMIFMPLSFSISVGMSVGFISWCIIKILLGKFKEIGWVMAIVVLLSLISLLW